MFYKVSVNDHIRVPPDQFGLHAGEALLGMIKKSYEGYISRELGIVIGVSALKGYREGVIIHGDGAAYYDCDFELLAFRPELQEVLLGKIRDIADFGAFVNIGVVDGMIHISQTMDDFVSFSSEKSLSGKESKRTLKVGDTCRARVIAVSFKDIANPKIGLTMRQQGLGKLEWIEEDASRATAGEDKPVKEQRKKPAGKKGRRSN